MDNQEKIEKLKSEARSAYDDYMYEECAERGYDYLASRAAWNRYSKAIEELKSLGVDYK